ncbi:hypothetical protein VTO42DRAFT_8988 [Malbranchea cinnamomea]
MGISEDLASDPPCHPRACAIQDCLTKNGYQEEKCRSEIIALYKCCQAFYQEKGDQAKTPSCPKPNLLGLKLRQLGVQ